MRRDLFNSYSLISKQFAINKIYPNTGIFAMELTLHIYCENDQVNIRFEIMVENLR